MRVRGRARLVARPRGRLGTCVRVDVALGVDDGELASLLGPVLRARVRITPPDRLDDLLGSDALAKQLDCARTVANVDNRLRCRGADAGLCREHAVADCEDARLHRAADLTSCRIVREDREGSGWPRQVGRTLRNRSLSRDHSEEESDDGSTHGILGPGGSGKVHHPGNRTQQHH